MTPKFKTSAPRDIEHQKRHRCFPFTFYTHIVSQYKTAQSYLANAEPVTIQPADPLSTPDTPIIKLNFNKNFLQV